MSDDRHDFVGLVRMNTREFGLADANTLYGYAAVFNEPTEINSAREGHFMETIRPGAFTRALDRDAINKVKVLYDHGLDPSVGNKPLGKPSVMREDDVGLYVEVPLDDTSYNRDLKASLKSGALDGMSFRFSVPHDGEEWDYTGDMDQRTLTNVILYELGPVTFPAYQGAAAGLRSWKSLQELAPLANLRLGHDMVTPPADPPFIGTPRNIRQQRARQISLTLR